LARASRCWVTQLSPGRGKRTGLLQKQIVDASNQTLYHRWRDGARDSAQLLEAYASSERCARALSGDLEPKHLNSPSPWRTPCSPSSTTGRRRLLAERRRGERFDSPHQEIMTAATGGNSVALLALLKLGAITAQGFSERPRKACACFSSRLQQMRKRSLTCCWLWILTGKNPGVSSSRRGGFGDRPELLRRGPLGLSANKWCWPRRGQWSRSPDVARRRRKPRSISATGTACQPRLTTRRR